MPMHYDPPPADEPAKNSQCHRVLRAWVFNPDEALSLAANYRWRAAEARRGIPEVIDSYQRQCRANWFGGIALEHEQIAAVRATCRAPAGRAGRSARQEASEMARFWTGFSRVFSNPHDDRSSAVGIRKFLDASSGHLSAATWQWLDEQTTDEVVRDPANRSAKILGGCTRHGWFARNY